MCFRLLESEAEGYEVLLELCESVIMQRVAKRELLVELQTEAPSQTESTITLHFLVYFQYTIIIVEVVILYEHACITHSEVHVATQMIVSK